MSVHKIQLSLEGIPQTLILPLLSRAMFSRESYSPLRDQRAIELVERIQYDFGSLLPQIKHSLAFWMARAVHFDNAIKVYLDKHPRAAIVNLGAGLETMFERIDNGKLQWIDLDLPEVIALRKKLLPANERVQSIAKSVLDFTWMDELKNYGSEFFFVAGGLFMYFTDVQVKALIVEISKRFPRSELIFDNISKRSIYYANEMLKKAHMQGANLQWGLDDAMELETWSAQIKIINRMPYFRDLIKKKFPFLLKCRMFFYDLHNKNAVIQLKF